MIVHGRHMIIFADKKNLKEIGKGCLCEVPTIKGVMPSLAVSPITTQLSITFCSS